MSPEQMTDAHTADQRSDIYSLGCLLYELLVGSFLNPAKEVGKAPARYQYIIHRSTKHAIDERYSSVSEMQRELALLEDEELLQAPSERVRALSTAALDGDNGAVGRLVAAILAGLSDPQLFLHELPKLPRPVLGAIALSHPSEFRDIVKTFCEYADGQHPFSFTDTIADFLEVVFESTSDLAVHEMVLERLLLLGYSHSRWYVGSKFVKVAVAAMALPMNVSTVQRLLARDEDVTKFVRQELLMQSIPLAVRTQLVA